MEHLQAAGCREESPFHTVSTTLGRHQEPTLPSTNRIESGPELPLPLTLVMVMVVGGWDDC